MKPTIVTHRNVKITIYPWRDSHRFACYDSQGARRYVTRKSLTDAKAVALDHAKSVASRTIALDRLDDTRRRILADLIEADPTLTKIKAFMATIPASAPTVARATAQFIAAKQRSNPKSDHNATTLARIISRLPSDIRVHEVTPEHIAALLTGAPRTRLNTHRAIRTFLRWCQRAGHLPDGATAADRVDVPMAPAGTPETWTPDELHKMLAACPKPCLPWIVLAAWAGIRTEEIYRLDHPLQWEDIDLDAGIITVRSESSKISRRRIIQITPALAAALRSIGPATGRIAPPGQSVPAKSQIATIGKPVGGWRRNALRHSFLTYRSALVGTGQAALEAGNSESVIRRHYLDATTPDVAAQWFDVPQMFRRFVDTPQSAASQKPCKTKDSGRRKSPRS
jgi:integrase